MPRNPLSWYLERERLVSVLEIIRPLTGSKINPICDNVRFTIISDVAGESSRVFVYGTNLANFICVVYGEIKAEGGLFEKESEHHFLVDLQKLFKICKTSNREKILIRELSPPEYNNPKDDKELTKNGRISIQTEANNQIQCANIYDFPHDDFSGRELIVYETNTLPRLWQKAIIAKGELDIRRTCLHYNGDLVTLDNSFACILQTPTKFKDAKGNTQTHSINLETGISDVITRMLGKITVKVAEAGNKIFFCDDETGIFVSVALTIPQNIQYERALTQYKYESSLQVKKDLFEACLKRAIAFIDRKVANCILFEVAQEASNWVLTIKSIEDQAGQKFEEQIPLISATGPLSAAYSVFNLLKSMDAFEVDVLFIKWRQAEFGRTTDNTMCLVEAGNGYTVNALVPSVSMVQQNA